MALSRSKSCNSHGHVASLPGAHHSAGAPQVVAGCQHLKHQFLLLFVQEGGVAGVVFVCLNSVGYLLLLGGLGTAEHLISQVSLQPPAHLERCPAPAGQNLAAGAPASARLENQRSRT